MRPAAAPTIAFVSATRLQSMAFGVLSVLLYLGAVLAKEVAVPLPLLLLALPARDARTPLRATARHRIGLPIRRR
jgi:hypothetical protein